VIWGFGVACLVLAIAMHYVEAARRRCPACHKRFFKLAESRCNQGLEQDAHGNWVRVAGVLSRYECKGCGAVRFTDKGSAYLTADELAAKNARFVSGKELYDRVQG